MFLDFISYSGGPLPEDLLQELSEKNDNCINNNDDNLKHNNNNKQQQISNSARIKNDINKNIPVRILWGENDPWEPISLGR